MAVKPNFLLGSVGKVALASSGPFPTWRHPAPSTIKPISPASPSLSGEKTLALRPTTEFSDRAYFFSGQDLGIDYRLLTIDSRGIGIFDIAFLRVHS